MTADRQVLRLDEDLVAFGSGDWFAIHSADRLRQIGGASVEGTGEEMLALAAALEARTGYSADRCRVAIEGDRFMLSSPRNTITPTSVPMERAAGLIASIRAEVAEDRAHPRADMGDFDADEEPLRVDVPTPSTRVRARARMVTP